METLQEKFIKRVPTNECLVGKVVYHKGGIGDSHLQVVIMQLGKTLICGQITSNKKGNLRVPTLDFSKESYIYKSYYKRHVDTLKKDNGEVCIYDEVDSETLSLIEQFLDL